MPLEPIFDFIDDMDPANPNNSPDQVKEAANHLRGVKNAVQGSFPNLGQQAVTLTAAQINVLPGNITTNANAILTNANDISTNAGDISTNASAITANTNLANTKIGAANYASSTVGGTVKARLSGTTLYMSNNGTNP